MNKLREKRNALLDKMDKLVNAAKTETRAFTDDEKAEYDKCKADIKSIDETIAREDEIRSLEIKKNKNEQRDENAEAEVRAFEAYLRGTISENRAAAKSPSFVKIISP